MTILNRYIFRSIVAMSGMVLLVLLSLGGFVEFIGQQDDIGIGTYGVPEALLYVLLKLPRLAAGMLPVSVLLGALLGLGNLANHSELIVMRTSGVSIEQLVKAVARAGIVVAIFGIVLGEYMSPPLDRYARQLKTFSKSGEMGLAEGQSVWVRDGRTIFNVSRAGEGNHFGGVYVFVMGGDGELAAIGRANSAQLTEENEWMLNNFAETVFTADGVRIREVARESQQNNLTADLLAMSEVRASSLDAIELYRYIQYLRNNGLNASRYQIAFWTRLSMAAGIVVMGVLALPFVLGELRSTGAGARMLVGVIIGLAYFLLSKTMGDSGEVYRLNPFLVAWLPTIMLAGVTTIALGRTR